MPSISTVAIEQPPLQLGVSACLLGRKVRYDGGHQYNDFIARVLAELFTLLPVCPEQEAGLSVPRPPVRLHERDGQILALGVDDPKLDVSQPLQTFSQNICEQLEGLRGFILKARSPSCGFGTTPVLMAGGQRYLGNGLFAQALSTRWPLMPIVQECDLETEQQQARFLAGVTVYAGLQSIICKPTSWEELLLFHHKQCDDCLLLDQWLLKNQADTLVSSEQLQHYGRLYIQHYEQML